MPAPIPAPIAMVELAAEHAAIAPELRAAFDRVLAGGRFILGPEVEAFEGEVARQIGAAAAVGCASGSDALYLALLALDVGRGDEVVTTSFSFIATAEAIARTGARPVFADIDPETLTIDPRSVADRIGPRTKAIIPVHLFGQAAPTLDFGLPIIEDAAQAIGARAVDGRAAGTIGRLAALSFFPTKNLGAIGDAGVVLINKPELAARVRSLRVHGASREPDLYAEVGINSRLDALQAAILRVKLAHLAKWTEARRANARIYFEELSGVAGIKLPRPVPGTFHVFNQYTVRVPARDQLRAKLSAAEIASAVYYSVPLHRQPCFSGYSPHECPEAERAAREVISLPVHPTLTRDDISRVVGVVRNHALAL